MRKRQYVYVLSNPSMPGLLKIGKTKDHPTQRMAKLHSSGVPTPFVLEFSCVIADCDSCERLAHAALESYRVALNREFFKVSFAIAIKKILPAIGNFKIDYVRDEARLPPSFRTGAMRQTRAESIKALRHGKAVFQKARAKTVISPAAWPFPCSSRP